jgi:hypothetical protein
MRGKLATPSITEPVLRIEKQLTTPVRVVPPADMTMEEDRTICFVVATLATIAIASTGIARDLEAYLRLPFLSILVGPVLASVAAAMFALWLTKRR